MEEVIDEIKICLPKHEALMFLLWLFMLIANIVMGEYFVALLEFIIALHYLKDLANRRLKELKEELPNP